MAIKYSDKGTLNFSPVRGKHYLVSRGNTVTREIFYDEEESAPILPISPLIPVFEQIFRFPFTWKSLMPEQDAKKRGLRPLVTYQVNMKGANETLDDDVAPQKMCIVQRSVDDQHYLLDREVHPIEINIASIDGTDVKLIFLFTIQILDMKLLLAKFPGGNFLQYAEKSVIAKLRSKLPRKKFDDIRGVASEDGSPVGLQDDLNEIRDELNREEFETIYGFKFLTIIHEDWIITPEAAARLKAVQEVELAKLGKKVVVTKAEGEADATKIKGNAETEVQKKRTTETGNAQTDVLKKRTAEVGKAEVDVLKQKIKAITPLQKLMNANSAAIAESLKDLDGTLITDKGALGGSNLVEMLIANSIQDQKKLKDENN